MLQEWLKTSKITFFRISSNTISFSALTDVFKKFNLIRTISTISFLTIWPIWLNISLKVPYSQQKMRIKVWCGLPRKRFIPSAFCLISLYGIARYWCRLMTRCILSDAFNPQSLTDTMNMRKSAIISEMHIVNES